MDSIQIDSCDDANCVGLDATCSTFTLSPTKLLGVDDEVDDDVAVVVGTPSDFDALYEQGLLQDSAFQNELGSNAREFNITAGSGPGKVRPGRVVVANSDGSPSGQKFLIGENCAVIIVCSSNGCPSSPTLKSPCTYGGLVRDTGTKSVPQKNLHQ